MEEFENSVSYAFYYRKYFMRLTRRGRSLAYFRLLLLLPPPLPSSLTPPLAYIFRPAARLYGIQ